MQKVAKIGKKWRIERTKQTKQHKEFPQKIHGGIMAKKSLSRSLFKIVTKKMQKTNEKEKNDFKITWKKRN